MTNIKAGVVLVTRYTTPHSSVYESYIDYMARDCATRQRNASKFMLSSLSDDLSYVGYAFDYMDDARKSSNLFTATKDNLSKDDILELQTAFRTAQKNGSPMWQSIISFDNAFLEQYGIYRHEMQLLDEKRIRSLTRVCMKRMLQKRICCKPPFILQASTTTLTTSMSILQLLNPYPLVQKLPSKK